MSFGYVVNGRLFHTSRELREWVQGSIPTAPEWEASHLNVIADWLSPKDSFDFYTSGTTGEPARISFSREQIEASARLTSHTFAMGPGSRALLVLPSSFVAGRMMIYRALVNRWELNWTAPSGIPFNGHFPEADFTAITPHQAHTLLKQNSHALDAVRVVLVGGGKVGPALATLLCQSNAQVYETYGATETLTHIGVRQWQTGEENPWFMPLKGVDIGLDNRGCLLVRAAHLGGGQIITQDMAELRDGTFRILGRADGVINSGGIKLFPESIEGRLEGSTERSFCVVGVSHERFGQVPWLVMEGSPLTKEAESTLFATICGRLDKFERPFGFSYLSEIPRTSSGKIQRSTLIPFPKLMNELVVASANKHKIEELNAILGDRLTLLGLDDIQWKGDIPEDGDTLEANAFQKAERIHAFCGKPVIADDTGLEVNALGGAPGVYSARYAGSERSDEANRKRLLNELEGVADRSACFRTVICLIDENGAATRFEGRIDGDILTEEKGTGGFGYDPLFRPTGFEQSFAEMTSEEKNQISHRARAAAALADFIRKG